jgi:hypothetical protein
VKEVVAMKRLLAALVLAMGLSLAQGVVLRALMEDVPENPDH